MLTVRPLPGLPPYGPPALAFPDADACREGFVVEFVTNNGKWVGNFRQGFTPERNSLHAELGSRAVLVISGDAGYLVDAEDRRLIRDLGCGIEGAWFIDDLGAMVISNGLWLEAFDADRVVWQSRRFSWDGLRNLSISGAVLTGEAIDPMLNEWMPFTASLSTGEVEGGSYNGPE